MAFHWFQSLPGAINTWRELFECLAVSVGPGTKELRRFRRCVLSGVRLLRASLPSISIELPLAPFGFGQWILDFGQVPYAREPLTRGFLRK
jgi:hypothetical protein